MSKSEYRSNRSVAQTPKLLISVDDPRLDWDHIALTKATLGADFDIVGLDGKLIVEGGTTPGNPSGTAYTTSGGGGNNYTPPLNNQPPVSVGYGAIVPADITNLDTAWNSEDLVVTFDWDPDDPANATVSEFVLEVTEDGVVRQTPYGSFPVNKTQSSQTVTLTKTLNRRTLGTFSTNITSICVYAIDPFYNKSANVCDTSVPAYVLDLPVPVITVTAAVNGYNVAYTIPTQSVFDAIDIVEYESTASSEPTGVTYSRVYFDSISPANILTVNTNSRWVKARFSSDGGTYTAFSAAQKITPTSPVTVDTTGPSNVLSVTAEHGIDTSGYLGFNGYADISWPAVSDSTLRGYRIRFSNDGGATYTYANSPGVGTAYRLGGLAIGSTYKIAVATYDEFNNTSSNYVSIAQDLTIEGTPSVSNYITAGPFQFGTGVGNVSANRGLYFDSSNYWYVNSSDSARLKVGGDLSNYVLWDGSKFTIDGDITARGGYFAGNVNIISGGSLYSGTVSGGALIGAGYILNEDGITFNSSSVNGITSIDANSGHLTTKSANIGGWNITEDEIERNESGQGRINLNSALGYISVSSDNVVGKTAGINSATSNSNNVFWSGGSGPTDTANSFRVTLGGTLYAKGAEIDGTIRAVGGGFGTLTNGAISKGWSIDQNGLIAVNNGTTDGYGRIKLGDYSIKSNSSSDFIIYDDEGQAEILETNTSTAATDPKRIFLGDYSRHVEVKKSASLSGLGTNVHVEDATPTQLSAYRSGGLRNIFTVTQGNYNQSYNLDQDINNNDYSILYPSANKGDVMVVYDPNDPSSEGNWNKITAIYINTRGLTGAPANTALPEVTPTSGDVNVTQFSVTNGTWTGDTPISYTYQWRYNDQGSVWIAAPGTNNLSTYTPPEAWDIDIYGTSLRCYVTATNGVSSATVYSNTVTVSADPVIIDGPFTFVTDTSVTVTFAAANTKSWAIYGGGPVLLGSGNGSYGDATQNGLQPGTGYSYNVRIYSGLNQTGTYVDTPVSTTTSGSSTTTTTTTTTTATTTSSPSQYTVTWNAMGGSGGGTTGPLDAGSWHNAPSPGTKSGYSFSNWRYPSAGDLIYTVPDGGSFIPESSVTMYAVWIEGVPPSNTSLPEVTPSSGIAGSTQFSSTTGTWSGTPTLSYEYQWKYNDQGSLWLSISGATSSTYTPPSNYVSLYGSGLRCYVTATNSSGSSTAYAPEVTVSAPAGTTTAAPTTTTAAPTTTTAAPTTAAPTTAAPSCTPGSICNSVMDPQGCIDFYVYDSSCNCVYESKYC